MFSKYELLYLFKILDYYEPELVKIIKYYINNYTINNNKELRHAITICCNIRNEHNIYTDIDIKYWDVSNITDMSMLFSYKYNFNDDISRWDTSSVINMNLMFQNTYVFNQPIGNWDVSNVTNMKDMFCYAKCFNQPLNNWDISNVTNMSHMFSSAKYFNQPLDSWNTSKVIYMNDMFSYAINFNQPIGSWNIENVINIKGMLGYTTNFNQPLCSWNISKVKNIEYIFYRHENNPDDNTVYESDEDDEYIIYNLDFNIKNLIINGWLFNEQTNYNQPDTISHFKQHYISLM